MAQHFLCENQSRDLDTIGRRTHMSFEAFKALINAGFVDKKKEIDAKKFVRKISSKMAAFKSKCLKYEGKDRILTRDNLPDEPEDFDQDEESSSSGIESGGISSNESGKTSPVDQILEKTSDSDFAHEFVEKIIDDRFELHLR